MLQNKRYGEFVTGWISLRSLQGEFKAENSISPKWDWELWNILWGEITWSHFMLCDGYRADRILFILYRKCELSVLGDGTLSSSPVVLNSYISNITASFLSLSYSAFPDLSMYITSCIQWVPKIDEPNYNMNLNNVTVVILWFFLHPSWFYRI